MKTARFLFYCLLSATLVYLASCKGDQPLNDKKEQDSIKAEKEFNEQMNKIRNEYLIQPPDTGYTGDYIDKYPNGNTKFKGFFRFGKRHGEWMAWYANGVLWSECFYDKGVRNGPNNVFYESGKPRYKGWYKNDLRDSVWTFYDAYGKVVKEVKFKDDEELK